MFRAKFCVEWLNRPTKKRSESSEASSAVLSEVPCEIVATTNVIYETYNRRQSDTVQNNNKLTDKKTLSSQI